MSNPKIIFKSDIPEEALNSMAMLFIEEIEKLLALLQERSVYILDEPTASQDPKAENELNQLFTEVMHDKTLLLITHRLSTLSGMDYIYLLNNGRIVEEGTHEDLMSSGGQYAHIYTAQSKLYAMEDNA